MEGGPRGVSPAQEGIRGPDRRLLEDAAHFDEIVKAVREGFYEAAGDEHWFPPRGCGKLPRPDAAAREVDAFIRSVIDSVDHMGRSMKGMMRELAESEVGAGADQL